MDALVVGNIDLGLLKSL